MNLQLIAVGQKMPSWINEGFLDYQKRFQQDLNLQLIEVAAQKRTKNSDIQRILQKEGQAMLSAVSKGNRIVLLDVIGQDWSTPQLAQRLESWKLDGRDVSLLIGGPEGIHPDCRDKAEERWSLSHLTLPHPLVRVIVAESLYRAWSLTVNHPYHRE